MPASNSAWAAAMITDGTTLLINAPATVGQVFVLGWNGTTWQAQGNPNVLPAGAAGAASLGLDGPNAALSGSPGANAAAGVLNLYSRNGAGVWNLAGQLTDAVAVPGQRFGTQLARTGDVLVVTAMRGGCQPADPTQHGPGHVNVFQRVTGGWQYSHALQPPGPACAPKPGFGAALAFDGVDLFIGAPRLPAPGVAGALGASLRYRAGATGVYGLIDALRPTSPLAPLSQVAPYGTTDQRRYGLAVSASAGRVAVFSPMELSAGGKPSRTTLLEPVAGATNAYGQCVCLPGWSGKACAVKTCTKGQDCDDGNACTSDSCDTVAGTGKGACVYGVNVPKGQACSDGDACTAKDACEGGVCVGFEPKVCDDGKFCTTDVCDPKRGSWLHKQLIGCKG